MIRPTRLGSAILFARTVGHLRPSQVAHRVRLTMQRSAPVVPALSAMARAGDRRERTVAGWPVRFVPLDLRYAPGLPSPADNVAGRFRFLGHQRGLGQPVNWAPEGVPRLWFFNLHYFEWAWSFATHEDLAWARTTFSQLWRSWERSTPFARGDQWSPYVASVRAWTLCGVHRSLVAGTDVDSEVRRSLARHAWFVRWHIEHDVGGNHLIKNIKALAGLGVFLADDELVALATRHLGRQLSIQVLPDGGHYERSPSYHAQVLGDLIDVSELLFAAGYQSVLGLADAIDRMRDWLRLMLLPDGEVPLLNDAVPVGRERLAVLGVGPPARERLTVLADSGYVVVRTDDTLHLIADVGLPGPPHLPAHVHADLLSFELAAAGERFVVDTGTSTYEPGARRQFERSTAAHNTIEIDGCDQSEVWGTFRAARLARPRLEAARDDGHRVVVTAAHDGYRRLRGRPVHRRTWVVSRGRLEVRDSVIGTGRHRIDGRLHLAEAASVGDGGVITGPGGATIEWSGPDDMTTSLAPCSLARGFGDLTTGHVATTSWTGDLPVAFGSVFTCPVRAPVSSAGLPEEQP